jgi:hypothetical protein
MTNSSRYGITRGSRNTEFLELTADGRVASDPDATGELQLRARFKLAIELITPFRKLYDRYKDSKLPGAAILQDFLKEEGYKEAEVKECVETFIVNAKFLGLLRTISGSERLLSLEYVLEEMPARTQIGNSGRAQALQRSDVSPQPESLSDVCFYITPIGEDGSPERLHSDLFLESLVEPAIESLGLRVVRADRIGKPGMITPQIIEHLVKAKLVVADLTFHNPNVFYELCLRHALRLPTVHVIRTSESIPFDIGQFRTIRIDDSTIYALVPQIEVYRAEIASHARMALEEGENCENPLGVFYPSLRAVIT